MKNNKDINKNNKNINEKDAEKISGGKKSGGCIKPAATVNLVLAYGGPNFQPFQPLKYGGPNMKPCKKKFSNSSSSTEDLMPDNNIKDE